MTNEKILSVFLVGLFFRVALIPVVAPSQTESTAIEDATLTHDSQSYDECQAQRAEHFCRDLPVKAMGKHGSHGCTEQLPIMHLGNGFLSYHHDRVVANSICSGADGPDYSSYPFQENSEDLIRRANAQEVFDRARSLLRQKIMGNRTSASQLNATEKRLIERLNSVSLEIIPVGETRIGARCRVTPNGGAYFPSINQVSICGENLTFPSGHLAFIIGHELGHAMSLCMAHTLPDTSDVTPLSENPFGVVDSLVNHYTFSAADGAGGLERHFLICQELYNAGMRLKNFNMFDMAPVLRSEEHFADLVAGWIVNEEVKRISHLDPESRKRQLGTFTRSATEFAFEEMCLAHRFGWFEFPNSAGKSYPRGAVRYLSVAMGGPYVADVLGGQPPPSCPGDHLLKLDGSPPRQQSAPESPSRGIQ